MRGWRLVLCGLLVLGSWYRAHTFAPSLGPRLAASLWPAASGDTEPLDCDESAYAYMGHRVLAGDALYRDLTENKPPLGYWLYALAVAIGGYRELTIRVMPIPFVLATIAIVWWIARRLERPGSRVAGGGVVSRCEHRPVPLWQRRQPRALHELLFRGRAGGVDPRAGVREGLVPHGRRIVRGGCSARQTGRCGPGDCRRPGASFTRVGLRRLAAIAGIARCCARDWRLVWDSSQFGALRQ